MKEEKFPKRMPEKHKQEGTNVTIVKYRSYIA